MTSEKVVEIDEDRLEQCFWEFKDAAARSGDERWHFKGFVRAFAASTARQHASAVEKSDDR